MRQRWPSGFELWLAHHEGGQLCVACTDRPPRESMERMGDRDAHDALKFEAMVKPAAFASLIWARHAVAHGDLEYDRYLEEFLAEVADPMRPFSVWQARSSRGTLSFDVDEPAVDLTDLAPAEAETPTTWFEVIAADQLGEPIEGVAFGLRVDGVEERLDTDGQGKARHEGAETSFATARIADEAALQDTLTDLWDQVMDGEWLDEQTQVEHTFVPFNPPLPSIGIKRETPHTVVFVPLVARARLVGGMFDTNKCFLLPEALGQIKSIVRLYDGHPQADLAIVGHTDTTGTPAYNDPLSLERADAFKAFLTDDVEAWLEWYGAGKPAQKRWGDVEDRAMLDVVLLNLGVFDSDDPVRAYQALKELEVDGIMGPNTRTELITDYMATDGTSLPAGIEPISHGCGESFPLADDAQTLDVSPPDGEEDFADRRVEAFFFDQPLGILPQAEDGDTSSTDADPYLEWRRRARETSDFAAVRNRRLAIKVVDDKSQAPVPGATVALKTTGGVHKGKGKTDAYGVVVFDYADAIAYEVGIGTEEHSPVTVEHEVKESDDSSSVTIPVTWVGKQKYELEELVETVVRSGKWGTVKGAAEDSKHVGQLHERKDKNGSAYKQYINVSQDTQGEAKRFPEQGRTIELRAKLTWVTGDKTKSLEGKNVKWTAVLKAHSGSGRPASFEVNGEKPGFGGTNDKLEETSSADENGWAKITFHLSQYAGDEFTISANVDDSDADAHAKDAKKTKPYVVWRKFWYQTTKPEGSAVPTPTDSITAYDKVGADMLAADTGSYKKADKPPAGTFYPKGMLETGSADKSDGAVIGRHNRTWFWDKATTDKTKPVKGHLIICDAQWDPSKTPSSLQTFEMKSKSQEVAMDLGAWNAGILKPALNKSVVVSGSWKVDTSKKKPPKGTKTSGSITDANVSIPLPRTALNRITITLPGDAPDPTKYRITVSIKVRYGKFYAGESVGVNMLIVYEGKDPDFFQVVSHEFGHGFLQVPAKPSKRNSKSLSKHPNQYDEGDNHGGLGSHCSKDKKVTKKGIYRGGTCIMFHQVSPKTCTQEFCSDCEPHLRLQPMNALKT